MTLAVLHIFPLEKFCQESEQGFTTYRLNCSLLSTIKMISNVPGGKVKSGSGRLDTVDDDLILPWEDWLSPPSVVTDWLRLRTSYNERDPEEVEGTPLVVEDKGWDLTNAGGFFFVGGSWGLVTVGRMMGGSFGTKIKVIIWFEGLTQKGHNSIANALELCLFCIKPLNWPQTTSCLLITHHKFCFTVGSSILNVPGGLTAVAWSGACWLLK